MTDPLFQQNYPIGLEGRIYYGAAGTTAATLLSDDQKATIDVKNTIVKWSTRTKKRKNSKYGEQEVTISFSVAKNNSNASVVALQAAAQGQTIVALKVLDQVSGNGIDCDVCLDSCKESQDGNSQDVLEFECSTTEVYRDVVWINGETPGSA